MSSQLLIHYISQYGYAGLFVILGTSILGIPIPDEFLMTFVGFLSYSGQLNPVLAILSAATGSATGITVAYFLGTIFQQKALVHLKKHAGGERLEKVLSWYQRHGGKLLTVGYFIPGVRHLSGYIAGLSRLKYRSFAFFAYLGAILWTTLFITLGRLLGSRWETLLPIIHRYALLLGTTVIVIFIIFYLIYKKHEQLIAWLKKQLLLMPNRYFSLGKQRLIFTLGGLIFTTLFIVLMGLIQDFVFQEVGEFDSLVVSGLEITSTPLVINFMRGINALGTHLIIMLWFVLGVFVLRIVTKNWSHVIPLALAWGGGTVIEHLFRFFFRGENIKILENLSPFQAPSSGFLLAAISFYIVMEYIIGRNKLWPSQVIILICEIVVMALLALSPVYLRIHTPSAMVTSLTVSGLWALVCVFVYEVRIFKAGEND
ncbi:MAG: DedA family protein [Desulfitobacteriaceae bacterium]